MGVRTRESSSRLRHRRLAPGGGATAAVFLVALLLLLANGRPIGAGDPTGAAGWLWRAVLAAAGLFLTVDATGAALIGKLLAALFAALAAAALFGAVARRNATSDARWAGLALAWGTTLAAAAQSWSGEAAAASAVAIALLLFVRADAEEDPGLAARAGLPLGLAVAFEPATLPLAVVLGLASAVRWRRAPALLAWAVPGAVVAIAGALLSARAERTPDPGPLALLLSPAKGALLFAPVAVVGVVGLLRALRSRRRLWDEPEPNRTLPVACGLAVLAHLGWVAARGGWADGVFWGPRLLAPAWPLLLLFVPEGLAALHVLGTLLVLASIAVQTVGAISYDGRWDRLNRGPRGELRAAWDAANSPIAFQWREGVARLSLPDVRERRLVVHEHALVRGDQQGSFVSFRADRLRSTGADRTMEALRLEQGARLAEDRLELRDPGDGIAFRVREGARPRRLELRVSGRGQGRLGLAEAAFWKQARWRERDVSGPFRLRLPYAFAESGAPELLLVLRSGGPVTIDTMALVPPGEPDNVIRLP